MSVVPLIQVLESYRVPNGVENSLEMKILVARQLGLLKDTRAVYYLSQHVNIGETDDEISNPAFRAACCDAISLITGIEFEGDSRDEAVRNWWLGEGQDAYNELAI